MVLRLLLCLSLVLTCSTPSFLSLCRHPIMFAMHYILFQPFQWPSCLMSTTPTRICFNTSKHTHLFSLMAINPIECRGTGQVVMGETEDGTGQGEGEEGGVRGS
ncbi:hypothetical protein L202_00879 [Cryptococcus amylolentus CBS 6039]|uniref:Secreted protein n=1 Tax=Cryptococcus amylolentus CBS 6039 TaxID=1295533 RepID=A0A1E3I8S5_9TREE|nr:hypothetical protein L202_00879 [Cryptococcus amylolentus CBS 6039]ODN85049.1 hypothetical protein L202_00879 [Cryptococcus amylolentus CBS 6039]